MIDHTTSEPKAEGSRNRLPPDEPKYTDGSSNSSSENNGSESRPSSSAAELFAPLMAHLHEFLEYAAYYLAARTDLVRAQVRKVALYAVLGIVGAAALITTLVVAVVMVLIGIAGGLGELLADRPWAGSLLTGCILLAIAFGSVRLMLPQWLVTSRRKVKEKYDRRRQTQRARFGHDINEVRKN